MLIYDVIIYYKMDGLNMIASIILTVIELFIFLSPFILGWIVYSYIFSKLIYSFARHYLYINISFSRTQTITFLSGMTSLSILYAVSTLFNIRGIFLSSIVFIIILSVTLGIPIVFISSLIAYKHMSNINLRAAIVMSFATLLAWLTFTIIVIVVGYIVQYLYNILFPPPPPKACCALNSIK